MASAPAATAQSVPPAYDPMPGFNEPDYTNPAYDNPDIPGSTATASPTATATPTASSTASPAAESPAASSLPESGGSSAAPLVAIAAILVLVGGSFAAWRL